jgi:cold shock CspA family protein
VKTTILTLNKKVACSVPENTGRNIRNTSGFGTVEHKDGGLMALKVIFGNEKSYDLDDRQVVVYLAEQDKQQPWASQVYELNGQKFILVPEERILLVEFQE